DGRDYCTGVLVTDTVVLTAGHCLPGTFHIIAPYAEGGAKSGVAKVGKVLGTGYDANGNYDPAEYDVALLKLKHPMTVGQLAEPTVLRPNSGSNDEGIAVGRRTQQRTGALVRTKAMKVRSAVPAGYTHGLVTRWYSDPGDSGGPLFLVGRN